MSSLRKTPILAVGLLAVAWLAPAERASAQAVGFAPVIGGAPSGVGMNVAPVATADRRYVRLGGLNATFTDVLGFDTATVTGAVGGGGGGGGFVGGFGLPGGGGAGFQSVGVGATGFGAMPYGYGGYPAGGYGYGGYPVAGGYGYGAYPYAYGNGYLGGAQLGPPAQARTVNGLGALGGGIMNATGRGSWYRP